MAELDEGFKFSIIETASRAVVFSKVYGDEYLEDAFAAFITDAGGIELGTHLEIVEVVKE